MTIQERLRRSNLIMLVVPVVIAGILLVAGLGAAARPALSLSTFQPLAFVLGAAALLSFSVLGFAQCANHFHAILIVQTQFGFRISNFIVHLVKAVVKV